MTTLVDLIIPLFAGFIFPQNRLTGIHKTNSDAYSI